MINKENKSPRENFENNQINNMDKINMSNNSENGGFNGPSKRMKNKKTFKTVMFSLISVIVVSAIVGLSVALYFSEDKAQSQAGFKNEMEATYSRSYHDLLDGANELDVNLKKVEVASSNEQQQQLLYEIWSTSNLAGSNISTFESTDEGLMKAQKFLNQLGDYCHYLAIELQERETLTAKENETLKKLADVLTVLKKSLKEVQADIDRGKLFVEDGGILGDFSNAFKSFTDPSMQYPEMIYDGPFSDSLETREPVALKGSDITKEQGVEKIKGYFEHAKLSDIKYVGNTNNEIVTLNYEMTMDGVNAFVQIAKKGGMLVSFNTVVNDAKEKTEKGSCMESAVTFAKNLGYEDMEVVWTSEANDMCFVNIAPVINNTIIYPDLIKVKVDHPSKTVIGFDAMHYIFNHSDRKIESPKISVSEAQQVLEMEPVREGRLALIPFKDTKEKLTYEFECKKNGTFYIYIDAMTGKEVNILYVIDTEQGTMLQ